jgi:uncharacterized protein (DUF362 family)
MASVKTLRPKVGIRQGGNPAGMTVELLREVVTQDFRNRSVLVKPNLGFLGDSGTGIITHCEVVRGVVRFMKEVGAQPFIGDSCIFGVNPKEVFERSGTATIAREEGVDLINLDEGRPVPFHVPDPYAVDGFKVSSYAAEADRIVSVPVMKTHMHVIASLSLKNMKGCLHQREKMRFHHLREEDRFLAWHPYKNLDRAVADLASVLYADLAVIDGIVAMEGLGPGLGEPKPLGLVLAGEDSIATDIAALFLMGFTEKELPHLALAMTKRKRTGLTFEDLDVDREAFLALRSPFKRAVPEDISAQFPEFTITSGETCSACDATMMAFLKTWGKSYSGKDVPQIAMGKRIDPRRIHKERCILVGNCTAKLREMGIFLEGCPPIPSDILKAIDQYHSEGI